MKAHSIPLITLRDFVLTPNRMKAHSIPLITLRDFVLTPNQTHPTMTNGYEQLSLAGHAQVLKKLQPMEQTSRCKKERIKTKLC